MRLVVSFPILLATCILLVRYPIVMVTASPLIIGRADAPKGILAAFISPPKLTQAVGKITSTASFLYAISSKNEAPTVGLVFGHEGVKGVSLITKRNGKVALERLGVDYPTLKIQDIKIDISAEAQNEVKEKTRMSDIDGIEWVLEALDIMKKRYDKGLTKSQKSDLLVDMKGWAKEVEKKVQ
ncbi:hypothetical protein EV368DRAFT_65800 [Lentinula lateritia]|nr:hypothetical protein EV368DRAFT_65800 [Lentinula lateritia]